MGGNGSSGKRLGPGGTGRQGDRESLGEAGLEGALVREGCAEGSWRSKEEVRREMAAWGTAAKQVLGTGQRKQNFSI